MNKKSNLLFCLYLALSSTLLFGNPNTKNQIQNQTDNEDYDLAKDDAEFQQKIKQLQDLQKKNAGSSSSGEKLDSQTEKKVQEQMKILKKNSEESQKALDELLKDE